jgi:ParB family transcriptional regulator, chromosome partitioning protein
MSKNDKALLDSFARKDNPERRAQVADTTAAQSFLQESALQKLPLDMVDTSPFQSRGKMDEAHLQELQESMRIHGQIAPIVVRIKPDGRYELIAGHHRVTALRAIGETMAKAEIKKVDDATAARMLTADNAQHKGLTDWELYKHIKMLRETKAAVTQTQLAEVLSFSRQQIGFIECFRFLPESAHALLDAYPAMVGATLAQALKPYAQTHPRAVQQALEKLAEKELTQGGVITWIKKAVEPQVEPVRKTYAIDSARFIYTKDEAKISGQLDYDRIHAWIAENYDSLRTDR